MCFITHKICQVCFKQAVKFDQFNCKKCKVYTNDKVSNCKVKKVKFNKYIKSLADALNINQSYIEFKTNSNNLNDKRSLSLIQYTHKCDNIHSYEWSNFEKIEQLGEFIINSDQITILEFIFRWVEDLQSIPRIQSFISKHKSQFKETSNKPRSQLDSVLARPLLLILQNNFWKDLMESYFKYFHPAYMLFSLVDFDPKKAPKSLLSAIYFAGYIIHPNRPEEIFSYMKTYAICNIKKIQFTVNLSNAQALAIYCFAFQLNRDVSLARVCLSHFGRMSHALGINIHRKNLPDLAQYNTKLVYNFMKLYYSWTKLGPLKYLLMSEEDQFNLDIYESKYQLPNSCLNLGTTDNERTIYSIFTCKFNKLINMMSDTYFKLGKYDSKRIKSEIELLNIKTIEEYESVKFTFESLMSTIPECKNHIMKCLELIRIPILPRIICINSKILQISGNTNKAAIKAIINSSIELLELLSNRPYLLKIWRWGPDILALYLIQIYPHCAKMQRKTVLFLLKSLIDFYYNYDFNFNPMNHLILISRYNLIKNSV